MPRPLEVVDIFCASGPAWRAYRALRGLHAHSQIAYNACRNRHCPKCQGAAARTWLADREAELLPVVAYCHDVFTLPAPIADIAYQNKAEIYASS